MKDVKGKCLVRSLLSVTSMLLILILQSTATREAHAQDEGAGAEADPWADVEEMLVIGSGSAGLIGDLTAANSVTAFDDTELKAIGAGDISDLAAFTPNLEIVTAGSTAPTFFIRGIGLNDFNSNAAGAVSIYQDDVALNSPALQLGSLFDIESANVLRGPQGTGAYRNASAGAIKSYSKKPSGDFSSFASIEVGNYNLVDIQSGLEFPVVEDLLSARVAFRLNRRGGIMKNRCAGLPEFALRPVRVGAQPNDQFAFCGEEVPRRSATSPGVSEAEPNQRKRLNQRRNFAARGVLRFTPDLPFDAETEWLLIARGNRTDQPSTVGQSIGTLGQTRFPETGAGAVVGRLGGPDAGRYRDLDVINAETDLVNELQGICTRIGCANPTNGDRFIAQRALAQELARDLDSDPYTGAYSHTGTTRNETFGISLRGDTDFGDLVHLKTVFGYDTWKRHVDVDLDFSPNTSFETRTRDRGDQFYAEAVFDGIIFENLPWAWAGPVEWQLGSYGLVEDLDVAVEINFGILSGLGGAPRARRYSQTVESFGGFTHLSWDFLEVFTLDGGFRFNWERRGIDYKLFRSGPPLLQNEEFTNSEPTGTVRLTFLPTEDVSMYAKYTRGWKSGTFNATGSNFIGVDAAGPEKIDAFEVGTNQSYFEGAFDLYVSFFHYAYRDYQLFTSRSGFQAPPEFVILNASDVELFGSEVEAQFRPPWWEGGLVDVRFAWLQGEFLEFVQTQLISIQNGTTADVVQSEIDNSGNRLLNAPEFTLNLTVQQSFPLTEAGFVTLRWDASWKDDTFFDATEGRGISNTNGIQFLPQYTIGQKAYWLHNVRVSFANIDGTFEIAGWVRNLLDRSYKTFSADLNTFQNTTLHFVGAPRTYGGTLSLKF